MDKKTLILSQAEKLFAEKGYYGLGLSELLTRCDIPKGSFYYYFPEGKIQLIQEVLEFSYQHMRSRILILQEEEPTALRAFSRMIDRLVNGVENRRRLGSLMMSMIAIESVYLDERVNATCKRIYNDWQQLYADWLRDYGYAENDCQRLAQAIFELVHGSLVSSWIKQDPADLLLAKASLQDLLENK